MRFYLNNDGNLWYDEIYWLGTEDHCKWFGVTCNDEHSVISIKLPNNEMKSSGNYPVELSSFTNLEYLDLSGNKIWGVIPDAICNMGLETLIGDARNCPTTGNCCTTVVPNA